MSGDTLDLIVGWASLVLTLFIFSYLLSDNLLYRLAVHILVGAAAGYAAIVAVEGVILPWLDLTVLGSDAPLSFRAFGLIPFLVALFILLKTSTRYAPLGNLGMAFIIGIGTGVALVGAIIGTVIPLVEDAGESFNQGSALDGIVMLLGTIGALVYFQYMGRRTSEGTIARNPLSRTLASIGQIVIAVTFGATYAGVILTSLNILNGIIEAQLRFLF